MRHADPRLFCRSGRLFPLTNHVREEPVTRAAGLRELLVAAIPVETDRRSTRQHAGRFLEFGQRSGYEPRPQHAAVEYPTLLREGPPAPADALACQVDDRADALEPGGVDRSGHRIPRDLVRGRRGTANDTED